MKRVRHWLLGDCHLHTTNSDGAKAPEQLYEALFRHSLDFAMITDHNFNTPGKKAFNYKGVSIIPGEEISGALGHVNIWGENLPEISRERPETQKEYDEIVESARACGGVISVNHPFDKKIPWKYDIENYYMDCVEVWNAPMHIDDTVNIKWWHQKLLEGKFIPAVGGSDYHKDYYVTNLLASPVTLVYAYSNSPEDVLSAVKKGNCVITNSPKAGRLFISAGAAVPGESIKLSECGKLNVECTKLKCGQTLRVYNNNTVIYEFKAKKTAAHSVTLDVAERGFVRAETAYSYNSFEKRIYAYIIAKIYPPDKGVEIPEFIYSLTNPIFFV